MAEIEIGEHRYRTGRLNAFEQFHVVRRIAPLLSGLGQTFARIPNGAMEHSPETVEEAEAEANVWNALGPLADALSKMPDDHVDYVLKLCLSKCLRYDERAGSWGRLTAQNGAMMYQDIDVSVMMQLVFETIQENLEGFFSAGPLRSLDGASASPLIS